jgi:organic hydroperoxide reductase OsmC/OhrA
MEFEPVRHSYHTQIEWTNGKKGILSCNGKPDIKVACPPEFGGHADIWSPEDLFVGATEVCLLTTFLWLSGREELSLISYESRAHGILELGDTKPRFSTIKVNIKICISSDKDVKKVEKIFKKIKKSCLISNSINTEVIIEPEIRVVDNIKS